MIFDAVYFDVALPATLAMMIERFRKRCWYRFAEKKQTNKSKKTMERKEEKKKKILQKARASASENSYSAEPLRLSSFFKS